MSKAGMIVDDDDDDDDDVFLFVVALLEHFGCIQFFVGGEKFLFGIDVDLS